MQYLCPVLHFFNSLSALFDFLSSEYSTLSAIDEWMNMDIFRMLLAGENQRTQEMFLSQSCFSNTNSTYTGPGLKAGFRDEGWLTKTLAQNLE